MRGTAWEKSNQKNHPMFPPLGLLSLNDENQTLSQKKSVFLQELCRNS